MLPIIHDSDHSCTPVHLITDLGFQFLFAPVKPEFTQSGAISQSNLPQPIGVRIFAASWREDIALAVAQHLKAVSGGWKQPLL
jgi:hypothetical protein